MITGSKKQELGKIVSKKCSCSGDFEVITSNEKLHILTETLTREFEKNNVKEAPTDLDSTDGIVTDTIKSIGEEVLGFFQKKLDSLNISEDAKAALKTLSKFVSVLTNKHFKNSEKIKNLLKLAAKVALKLDKNNLVSKQNYYQ